MEFEESALYLIAQKAEGALRDALSIFDRMVSFTQGNLSAKAVADNLNLLDHQTYADLGKIIFKNDIPGILKAYDDLLQRGIDPLQFIKGLGDFFRHLMLAKDPNTLALGTRRRCEKKLSRGNRAFVYRLPSRCHYSYQYL